MDTGRRIGIAVATGVVTLAVAASASAGGFHAYSVRLTIEADAGAGRIEGKVLSGAPSGFCDESKIRIREVKPGRDPVVARVKPSGGQWSLASTPSLSGNRVYAEVSAYKLHGGRPVECKAGSSVKVVAP